MPCPVFSEYSHVGYFVIDVIFFRFHSDYYIVTEHCTLAIERVVSVNSLRLSVLDMVKYK